MYQDCNMLHLENYQILQPINVTFLCVYAGAYPSCLQARGCLSVDIQPQQSCTLTLTPMDNLE